MSDCLPSINVQSAFAVSFGEGMCAQKHLRHISTPDHIFDVNGFGFGGSKYVPQWKLEF